MSVKVQFKPSAHVYCCNQIAFVQVAKTAVIEGDSIIKPGTVIPPRGGQPMDAAGWHVDNVTGEITGWYGIYTANARIFGLLGGPTFPSAISGFYPLWDMYGYCGLELLPWTRGIKGLAILGDEPRPGASDRRQRFVTCAACGNGKAFGTIYGCVTWGQEIDANNKWSLIKPQFQSWPPNEFFCAVEAWNAVERNDELPDSWSRRCRQYLLPAPAVLR
jgi:hypothetical protein